ncbi:unnamed protein product [Owenia fusiformis]|uniref:Ras-related protein Rab-36 n=2 Tax=Owenia fusiformis TaxID=6347 RepID=A0A8J1YB56_OWEFU|nr:unnamed protein product [Owenia fusiformis]
MSEKRISSTRKMTSAVAKDRVISRFSKAYHAEGTLYDQSNFSPSVTSACEQNRTVTVGVKLSKAVLVGDVAVGKTCFVNRFCHDIFDRDYKATIGVDFEVEKFSVLGVPFNLQIWDTAGQERFKCIAASYYRGANVVIVCFDMSNIHSLTHVQKWKEDACDNAKDPIVFLVGTKKDLINEHTFLDVERKAIDMATEIQAEFWPISSKTGENVKELFFRLVGLTFDKAVLDELDANKGPSKQIGTISISNKDVYEKKEKKKCC